MKTSKEHAQDVLDHCRKTLRKRLAVTVEDLEVFANDGFVLLDAVDKASRAICYVTIDWYDADGNRCQAEGAASQGCETLGECIAKACAEFDAAINGRADDANQSD